ncbi:ParB/RepB/Spo0J family partition protein [Actibacterium lipolyticum]|uniref:Nucleoid occlusion protein n=1 Tax=Actibacterium lipolyticum TaxID=1524263 RepID=A0A238L9R5_9RHOB|nr:ParB/RepB/Spo0J family partition protein [Actibacterium lipolyticum]SMX51056.1 Nucleoid occlusion protein [Actibacterium lipolyticum]
MAKRKRLTAPDAQVLQDLEEGFAAKPLETKSMKPPIAQVAGEAAALAGMANVTDRAEAARDKADADLYRAASTAGMVAQPVALDQIDADYIRRDRIVEDAEAMAELVASIKQRGLRSPIEVTQTDEGFGLISGFRRVQAFRQLAATNPEFANIPAFLREAGAGAAAYVSMVEENEVRANLSHYERGRIAVLSVGQGVFPSVEAAVDTLFQAASKAKRSKVRSFAVVHEGLGDLLRFPAALTERAGLKLAGALRAGEQPRLRAALDEGDPQDPTAEWRLLEAALTGVTPDRDPSKGGRPQQVTTLDEVALKKGGTLGAQISGDKLRIDLKGRVVNPDTARRIMQHIERLLG